MPSTAPSLNALAKAYLKDLGSEAEKFFH